MNRQVTTVRSRMIPLLFLASVLASPVLAAPILTVTAQGPQTFVEQTTNPLTSVTFKVTNNDPTQAYILDYALEFINWPAEQDDQVWNNGAVSASTFVLAATPANILAGTNVGTYTFGLFNKFGDPTDCCDSGVNPIDFYIEMSPLLTTPTAANIATNAGFGQFIFPIGGSSTGTQDLAQLANLVNCFNVPSTCAAAVNAGLLFSNGVNGIPFPATTSVTVFDTPEPAALWLFVMGCAYVASRKKRIR
jgi:hypothetical protein